MLRSQLFSTTCRCWGAKRCACCAASASTSSGLLAEFLEAGAGGTAQDRVSMMGGHMSTLLVGLPVITRASVDI